MHTAVSFTTLSARGTRFRMAPKACSPGRQQGRTQRAHLPSRPVTPRAAGGTHSGMDSLLGKPGSRVIRGHGTEMEEAPARPRACPGPSSLRTPSQGLDQTPYLPLEGSIQCSHNHGLPSVGHGLAELYNVRELGRVSGETERPRRAVPRGRAGNSSTRIGLEHEQGPSPQPPPLEPVFTLQSHTLRPEGCPGLGPCSR